MSAAFTLSGANPPSAGVGVPAGQRLLALVCRMGQTGMAVARCINRIARQRLEGQDIRRMAPPGFSATRTHFLVVQAVAWTAALRERLLALAAVRPPFAVATGQPKAARAPQGHGAARYLPDAVPNPTEDDWHDWHDLAKPLRIGQAGVAAAMQQIAGKSNHEVVTGVHDNLTIALGDLGAEADVDTIAAVAAEVQALLTELEAADAAKDTADDPAPAADAAPVAPPAGPAPEEPEEPEETTESEADDAPPKRPPDG